MKNKDILRKLSEITAGYVLAVSLLKNGGDYEKNRDFVDAGLEALEDLKRILDCDCVWVVINKHREIVDCFFAEKDARKVAEERNYVVQMVWVN